MRKTANRAFAVTSRPHAPLKEHLFPHIECWGCKEPIKRGTKAYDINKKKYKKDRLCWDCLPVDYPPKALWLAKQAAEDSEKERLRQHRVRLWAARQKYAGLPHKESSNGQRPIEKVLEAAKAVVAKDNQCADCGCRLLTLERMKAERVGSAGRCRGCLEAEILHSDLDAGWSAAVESK